MDDDDLLSHEIEAHQFLVPLDSSAPPPFGPLPAASERVWFRGGWTCRCVATSLPVVEEHMLLTGLIRSSIDIFQLGYRDDVGQSKGTHARGGCVDTGQCDPQHIKVWRQAGWTIQRRYPPFIKHGHGWPFGCPHLSPAARAQDAQWKRRQNGLVNHGPVEGPWPVPGWKTGMKRLQEENMALKDELVRDAVAQAVRQINGRIPVWRPVRFGTAKPQPVPADLHGWTTVNLNDAGDVSAVIGESEDVDLVGTIEVKTGPQPTLVRLWWARVDFRDGTPSRYFHYRSQSVLVPANTWPFGIEKLFVGAVPKPSAAGRSWRMRMLVRADQPVTITAAEVTGRERVR